MNRLVALAVILFASYTEARLRSRRSPDHLETGERLIPKSVERSLEQRRVQAPPPPPPKDPKEKCEDEMLLDKDPKLAEKCAKDPMDKVPPKDPLAPPPHVTSGYANTAANFGAGYQSGNTAGQQIQTTQEQTIDQMQQSSGSGQQQAQQTTGSYQQTQQSTGSSQQQAQQTTGSNQQTQQSSGGNTQTQYSSGNKQQTQSTTDTSAVEEVFTPSEADQPVAYTGKHVPNMSSDLLTKVIDCVSGCNADCTMFSVNTVYFDGVLDLNFPCLEKCMADKETLCSNVAMCQSKC